MQELEKILEEIEKEAICISSYYVSKKFRDKEDLYVPLSDVNNIIHNHMNDGWIQVEEALPEDGQEVLCCDDRTVYLVEYQAAWDAPFGDMDGIIAWQPLPEPYCPERMSND